MGVVLGPMGDLKRDPNWGSYPWGWDLAFGGLSSAFKALVAWVLGVLGP